MRNAGGRRKSEQRVIRLLTWLLNLALPDLNHLLSNSQLFCRRRFADIIDNVQACIVDGREHHAEHQF